MFASTHVHSTLLLLPLRRIMSQKRQAEMIATAEQRDEGLHAIITSGREHRDDNDDAGEKEPVLVVRSPKLLKSQCPIISLLQEGNELPVVHERDVHRKSANVREQNNRRQDAEENQQCFPNDRTKNHARQAVASAGLLGFRRKIHVVVEASQPGSWAEPCPLKQAQAVQSRTGRPWRVRN